MARKSAHGYNARKRLSVELDTALAESAVDDRDPGTSTKCSQILGDLIGENQLTVEIVAARANCEALTVADRLLLTLQRAQFQFLKDCRRLLSTLSSRLSSQSCWSFLYQHLAEARRFAVEDEFRELVFVGSGKFGDSRMLRTNRKYHLLGGRV